MSVFKGGLNVLKYKARDRVYLFPVQRVVLSVACHESCAVARVVV